MIVLTRYRFLASAAMALVFLITVLVAPASAGRDTTPPTAPTNLRAVQVSFTWARFAWDPSTDNSGEIYYYSFQIEPTTWNLAETRTTTDRLGGLESGKTYVARVKAVDRAGNQSAETSLTFTTLPRTGPPPTTPENLRAVDVDGRPDRLEWDPSTHDSSVYYELYANGVAVDNTADTHITLEKLWHMGVIESGPNYFTVRAWGEHEYPSGFSNQILVMIP
ncbi:fibronectin type III domain-containing protein [Pendulispora albinea]|uniref:Fibronectin type III domain-containing protein n=1 Tax=Pendulispora albinea TaxID=2741071 RepID=A0ABZ2LVA5_9BACT